MADYCKVGPDYPEFVERNGRRYSVSVDTDRDGMIEYFQLFDILTDDLFFEADYQIISLTEAEIWQIVDELNGVEETAELEAAAKAYEAQILFENEDEAFFGKLLDERYPQYGELGSEFRGEAIATLSSNWNESRAYQDILLDELAEDFEDED